MGPIDAPTAEFIREEIADAVASLATGVEVEIHDRWQCLVVRIEQGERRAGFVTRRLIEAASAILSREIRPRLDDFAWRVNIEHGGATLVSHAGGREAAQA